MKKIILSALFMLIGFAFAKTIHIKHAYLMRKHSDGSVYVIRVKLDDGFHDWYVRSTDKTWLFYGYESNDEIIVDVVTDIAIISY